MTDAQKMFALAKAVYPEHEWFITKSGTVVFDALTDPLCSNPFIPFDPANNSDQAIEVWCWLIAQWGTTDAGGVIEVRFNSRPKVYGYIYETTAQWRAAVLNAALRVISESARSPQ